MRMAKGMVISMRLSNNPYELKKTAIIAIFASVAVVLGIVESLIPFTVAIPGAKLGLGNIMVLTCLFYFRGRDALTLIVLKTLLTSFILGTFSTFLFSFLGALASFIIMFLMVRFGRNEFSIYGISVMGGIMHNVGQLGAAAIVLGTTSIFYYLPFLFITGVVTGIFVGIATKYLTESLNKLALFESLGLQQVGR
ncbi:Gx transporter family protein [Gorillibacterium massiliense]|uniref:Gx transporter family protein n=1 Tax=Gorillibacterium massiliense TaxID=1280390 RepID=UPI001EE1AEF8|nr:Gx transporter family protein [Gorillibacterium massiliense]